MFVDGSRLRGVYPTQTPNYSPDVFPPIHVGGAPTALAYDASKQRLYWADKMNLSIVYISLTAVDTPVVLIEGLYDVRDMAVDWISGNVYYTDAKEPKIGVVTSDGQYNAILIAFNNSQPISLALDVESGYGSLLISVVGGWLKSGLF